MKEESVVLSVNEIKRHDTHRNTKDLRKTLFRPTIIRVQRPGRVSESVTRHDRHEGKTQWTPSRLQRPDAKLRTKSCGTKTTQDTTKRGVYTRKWDTGTQKGGVETDHRRMTYRVDSVRQDFYGNRRWGNETRDSKKTESRDILLRGGREVLRSEPL